MQWNVNHGWGQVVGQLPFNPTGSVFMVGDSSTVNIDRLKQLFGFNPDGVVTYSATVQGAIDRATADAGDIIFIAPGHTETVDSTGDFLINKAGIKIIGLGQGDLLPLVDITSTSGKIQITENDVTLSNVRVRPGAGSSGCAAGIELLSTTAARNITLDGIVWGPRSSQCAALDTFVSLGTNSSGANYFDGLTIKNNVFQYYTTSTTGTGIAFNLVTDNLDNLLFVNNKGSLYSSAGWLQSSGTSYGWDISDSRIHNQSSGAFTVDINGTGTYGIMAHNYFSSRSTAAYEAFADTGAMNMVETYFGNASAADRAGRIFQTIT